MWTSVPVRHAAMMAFATIVPEVTFATVVRALQTIIVIQVINNSEEIFLQNTPHLFFKKLNLSTTVNMDELWVFLMASLSFFSDINECSAHPGWCQNGGTCIDKPGYPFCQCASRLGITGNRCERGKIRLKLKTH